MTIAFLTILFCMLPTIGMFIWLMITQADLTAAHNSLEAYIETADHWKEEYYDLHEKLLKANKKIDQLQLSQKQIQDLICKTAKETNDNPSKPISHLFGVSVDPSIAEILKDQAITGNKDCFKPVDLRGFEINPVGPDSTIAEQSNSQRIT